jgi:hypothetical protein
VVPRSSRQGDLRNFPQLTLVPCSWTIKRHGPTGLLEEAVICAPFATGMPFVGADGNPRSVPRGRAFATARRCGCAMGQRQRSATASCEPARTGMELAKSFGEQLGLDHRVTRLELIRTVSLNRWNDVEADMAVRIR